MKKIITCLLLILLFSALAFYVMDRQQRALFNKNLTNHVLYEVDGLMDLLNNISQQTCLAGDIKKNLEVILLNKIVIIASLKPEIDSLEGVPLKGLEKVARYFTNYEHTFDSSSSSAEVTLDTIALDYIRDIEKEVTEESKRRSRVYGEILKDSERKKFGLPSP